jgi:hypothetical protein
VIGWLLYLTMLLPKIGDLDRPLKASNLRLECTSKKIRW